MRRRRSDELAAIDEVQPLVDRFNELNQNQKMIFLDMVDPLPAEPEVKPTKKPKKKSTKSGGKSARASGMSAALSRSLEAQRRVRETADDVRERLPEHCAKCTQFSDANVHHLKTDLGYHEFVAPEQVVGVGGD